MSYFSVFLCVGLLPFVYSIQVHKYMTRGEVLQTFQTSHNSVPEYEVVPVFHKLHKRDAGKKSVAAVKVNAFNRKISLYLQPTEKLLAGIHTPVWTVVPDAGWPDRTRYRRVPNAFSGIGQPYQDPSKMAAIVAYEGEGGETIISGNLLSDLVVRPLPHRLHDTILSQTKNVGDSLLNADVDEEGFRKTHHHVVFKRQQPLTNSTHSGIKIVKRDRRNSGDIVKARSKRSIPEKIYPEILIIVDYSLYSVLGKNVKEATRYVLAFWNAVDLRYRLLEEPRIQLNIAGIIISLELGGTPYLENAKRGSTELDSDLAITAMSHYFYRESYRFRFSTYDMAVAMTHLDMCNVEYNGVCNPSTLGYAYEWGACNRSHVDMNTEAVGIVEDNGGYSAIIPAAHEVAHLMGAPHDGLMGSVDCPAWEGYIMSTALNYAENSFQWSNCSLRSFHEFFSLPDSTCIFNKPEPGDPVPLILPGKLLTLDEQCEKVRGTKACHHDKSVCTSLQCYIPQRGGGCRAVSAAAEGSFCGDGMRYLIANTEVRHLLTPILEAINTVLKALYKWPLCERKLHVCSLYTKYNESAISTGFRDTKLLFSTVNESYGQTKKNPAGLSLLNKTIRFQATRTINGRCEALYVTHVASWRRQLVTNCIQVERLIINAFFFEQIFIHQVLLINVLSLDTEQLLLIYY